jgi:uncharacterized membrane protein
MLAVVVSIARAEGPLTALYTFGALIAYLFFIAIFIRPILALIARCVCGVCVCVCRLSTDVSCVLSPRTGARRAETR